MSSSVGAHFSLGKRAPWLALALGIAVLVAFAGGAWRSPNHVEKHKGLSAIYVLKERAGIPLAIALGGVMGVFMATAGLAHREMVSKDAATRIYVGCLKYVIALWIDVQSGALVARLLS